MRLSSKITGEFIGVFLIGTLVGAMVMWDWAAVEENTLIGLTAGETNLDSGSPAPGKDGAATPDAKLSQFMSRTNDADQMIARINDKYRNEYHFTQEELDRIQPTVKELAEHVSQVRHQFGVDIIATLDTYHEKIAAQLTPEHRAAYEKANAEREKQISHMLLLDQKPSDQGAK